MGVITKSMLEAKHVDGEHLSGSILLKNCSVGLTKNGKYYCYGELTSGVDVEFKAWDNSSAFAKLRGGDLSGKVIDIVATWNEYMGRTSLVLETLGVVDNIPVENFLATRYNINAYFDALHDMLSKSLSEKGMKLAEDIVFSNESIAEAFRLEFAAKSHHDNCKGGLLAHTYKVCSLMNYTLSMYKNIAQTQDEKDLLMLGALLHDIGKIREMHLGNYTMESCVTHRFLGVELLDKASIVELYNEEWYYNLVSILLQHHGDFGDPCKTVVSAVVHKVDMFDSDMTLLSQKLEDNSVREVGSLKIDNKYLSIYNGEVDE